MFIFDSFNKTTKVVNNYSVALVFSVAFSIAFLLVTYVHSVSHFEDSSSTGCLADARIVMSYFGISLYDSFPLNCSFYQCSCIKLIITMIFNQVIRKFFFILSKNFLFIFLTRNNINISHFDTRFNDLLHEKKTILTDL